MHGGTLNNSESDEMEPSGELSMCGEVSSLIFPGNAGVMIISVLEVSFSSN